ncbi:MAG: ParB/RepB/Spo0J family partition protein [Elusimicrobia bacterium]|nr:ParB/RepB/Spo0J family partition protein [Elusimicrobiota bacterium]
MDITAQEIALTELHESPWNPRRHFPQKSLEELAESIRKVDVLSPLLVRPRDAGGYEIAAGHRRLRAAKLAKLAEVPCIVRPMPDQEFLEILTIENLQREDVHPLDEGEGYRTLMAQTGWLADEVAAKVGKSKSYVYQRLKLAELIEPAKKAFLEEKITAGHAILIARLTAKDQKEALGACFERWGERDLRSVRELARWIDHEVHLELSAAPWKKDDETLVPEAGACKACSKRSGYIPELFPEIAGKRDVCLDRACFHRKQAAHLVRLQAEAKTAGAPLPQLDTYGYGERKAGVLKHGSQWTEAKPGSCPHAVKGVIVAGDHIGQAKTVCTEKTCKEHWGGSASAADPNACWRREQAATARKKALKTALLTDILRQARDKVTALGREDLETLALAFFVDIWHEHQKAILRIEGWEDKPGTSHFAVAARRIPALTNRDLARLLFSLSHARALADFGYGYGEKQRPETRLREAAKQLGVNVAAIEKAQAAAEAERLRKKKEREAKTKKTAAKGNGKAAPAKTYPEPTCSACECTESNPCIDKGTGETCGWAKLDRKTNAGLCTFCDEKTKGKPAGKAVHSSAQASA